MRHRKQKCINFEVCGKVTTKCCRRCRKPICSIKCREATWIAHRKVCVPPLEPIGGRCTGDGYASPERTQPTSRGSSRSMSRSRSRSRSRSHSQSVGSDHHSRSQSVSGSSVDNNDEEEDDASSSSSDVGAMKTMVKELFTGIEEGNVADQPLFNASTIMQAVYKDTGKNPPSILNELAVFPALTPRPRSMGRAMMYARPGAIVIIPSAKTGVDSVKWKGLIEYIKKDLPRAERIYKSAWKKYQDIQQFEKYILAHNAITHPSTTAPVS